MHYNSHHGTPLPHQTKHTHASARHFKRPEVKNTLYDARAIASMPASSRPASCVASRYFSKFSCNPEAYTCTRFPSCLIAREPVQCQKWHKSRSSSTAIAVNNGTFEVATVGVNNYPKSMLTLWSSVHAKGFLLVFVDQPYSPHHSNQKRALRRCSCPQITTPDPKPPHHDIRKNSHLGQSFHR